MKEWEAHRCGNSPIRKYMCVCVCVFSGALVFMIRSVTDLFIARRCESTAQPPMSSLPPIDLYPSFLSLLCFALLVLFSHFFTSLIPMPTNGTPRRDPTAKCRTCTSFFQLYPVYNVTFLSPYAVHNNNNNNHNNIRRSIQSE